MAILYRRVRYITNELLVVFLIRNGQEYFSPLMPISSTLRVSDTNGRNANLGTIA